MLGIAHPNVDKPMHTHATAISPDSIELVVETLRPYVSMQSNEEGLRRAVTAYANYRAAHSSTTDNPYLYYVDFGLPSTAPRGYVFNMRDRTLVEGPFAVAHGRGSSQEGSRFASHFSNRPGSLATSLGLYVAGETYEFTGKAGGMRYRSIGLRLDGKSPGFNTNARDRGVVAHGAPYVTEDGAGKSEGCPAMEMERAKRLLPLLANGAIVYLYSPNDVAWLDNDPWSRPVEN
jgi:hypothetical protein